MKRCVLIMVMMVCAIAAYCQTEQTDENNRLKSAVQEVLLKDCFNDCRLENYADCLWITLILSDKNEQLLLDKLSKINSTDIKKDAIEFLDEYGLNSDVYSGIEFGKEIYGADNPFFSIQKGMLAYEVATNPLFSKYTDVNILYLSETGASALEQSIDEKLKGIVRELVGMGIGKHDVAMLVADKSGLDAGVIKNQKMTPYQLDSMMTMEKIEITDNEYIYHVSAPRFAMYMMSPADLNDVGSTLERALGYYIEPIGFFKQKGAEKFGLEIVYVYQASDDGEPLVKYIFNPYIKKCAVVPQSMDIIKKFAEQ